MFPKVLDGAQVLYYTPKEHFGDILYTTGEIAAHVYYLAICKYESSGTHYLFQCNSNYEVEGDSAWDSVEECMSAASSYSKHIRWVQAE
ncbi:MAG: hypothetical protein IJE08_08930 [Clostridia bacterium]|jgi:hypothetical protein|nr:hypothetical protein [Clostridia bacterium]